MAKLLKHQICRAVAATMQSCRSKDPNSTLPQNLKLSTIHFPSLHKHHVEEFMWKKEGKWHVVDKICEKRTPRREMKVAEEHSPPPPSQVDIKKKRRVKNKNVPSTTDHEEETETLVSSSMNISTDDEYSPAKQHRNINRRRRSRRGVSKPPPEEIPERLSMLKKLIPCTVDGKVKESFAVVKKSEDPYEDFKNSMTDMILEKQMLEEKDLEQLLQCFLSLNSRHYHGIILEAFCEIWDTIFTPSTLNHH